VEEGATLCMVCVYVHAVVVHAHAHVTQLTSSLPMDLRHYLPLLLLRLLLLLLLQPVGSEYVPWWCNSLLTGLSLFDMTVTLCSL